MYIAINISHLDSKGVRSSFEALDSIEVLFDNQWHIGKELARMGYLYTEEKSGHEIST